MDNLLKIIKLKNTHLGKYTCKSLIVIITLLSHSITSYSQSILFYSDTIVFQQEVTPEYYYSVKGDFKDILQSENFNNVFWFVNQLNKIKEEKRLNDYLTFEILSRFSLSFFGEKNSQKYQTAFVYRVLSELGFDIIVSNNFKIFINLDDEIYNTSVYEKGRKKYYLIYPSLSTSNYTFNNLVILNKSSGKKKFDIRITTLPNFSNQEFVSKQIIFSIGKNVFNQKIVLNKTLINLYETYPRSSFCIYNNTNFSDTLKASFEKNILPILKGDNNLNTIANILYFCHSFAEYKTDVSYYGKSKHLFPEEFLFYNNGDCEDYAFLLAYLINTYTASDALLVDYPNQHHINVGISMVGNSKELIRQYYNQFDFFIKPNIVKAKKMEYYICDATGIVNYKIGEPINYPLIIGDGPMYKNHEIIKCTCW